MMLCPLKLCILLKKTHKKTKNILLCNALDSNYIKKLNINVMLQNSLRGEPKYHPGNIFHRKNCYIPFILMINIYIYILLIGVCLILTNMIIEQELLSLPEYLSSPPFFSVVHVTGSLVICVCFVDRCLSFCPLSLDIVLSVLRFTNCDHPFDILKFFLLQNNVPLKYQPTCN
jgi:hypothetical protein